MAKLKVVSVFDVKADAFDPPFCVPALGVAVRMFADAVNSDQTKVHMHPEDYKLVQLGEFDDQTGLLEAVTPLSLGFGTDYVKKSNLKEVK